MADFKDAIKSGMKEYLDALKKAVDGLTPAELRWQPTLASNSISWIVWHMARVEDRWVNRVLRSDVELWIRDGWHDKFGMSKDEAEAVIKEAELYTKEEEDNEPPVKPEPEPEED